MDFQTLILKLTAFWGRQGCVILQPYDVEVGAGTNAPPTFFGVLGSSPWKVAYVQPSRRPDDGRYGENPNRLYQHHQLQVILKPGPASVQDLYLKSLFALGISPRRHDLRFVEDDWESPTLGASGLGWEVWCDGLEITQFTYFQQMGGFELEPVSVELTYGLERIAMFLQGVENVFDLAWVKGISYGAVRRTAEYEFSRYSFEEAEVEKVREDFARSESEARALIGKQLTLPAYDFTLKCSHLFNILDSRGAVSVSERPNYISRVRALAAACARLHVEKQGGESRSQKSEGRSQKAEGRSQKAEG